MIDARDAGLIAHRGEDVQRLLIAALGLGVVGPDLSDLAQFMNPCGTAGRARRKPGERIADQGRLPAEIPPGVQLRAHRLGQLARLLCLARLDQMVPSLDQVMQVGAAPLQPGHRPPPPVLGGAQVRGSQVMSPVRGLQDAMQFGGGPAIDKDCEQVRPVARAQSIRAQSIRAQPIQAEPVRWVAGGDEADGQQAGRLTRGDHAAEVGRFLVRRGGGPVMLANLEQQRIAIGRFTVDGRADQQPLSARAQGIGKGCELPTAGSVALSLGHGMGRSLRRVAGHAGAARNLEPVTRTRISFANTLLPRRIAGCGDPRDL